MQRETENASGVPEKASLFTSRWDLPDGVLLPRAAKAGKVFLTPNVLPATVFLNICHFYFLHRHVILTFFF